MANKTEKLNVSVVKPGSSQTFDPVFEVTECEGRGRKGGDFVYVTMKPHSGGASVVGAFSLRLPMILAEGTPLGMFARLVGQDPVKGFDVQSAVGKRIRLAFTAVAEKEEAPTLTVKATVKAK